MEPMTAKHIDLASHAEDVQASLLGTILPLLGAPHDGLKANIYGDVNTQLIEDYADVQVGDLAYSGGVCGTVTAILNDGEGSPTDNRIQVTYNTPYMQIPAASSVTDRVVVYNFVDNDESVATGDSKTETVESMPGFGVVFVRMLT